MLWRIADFVQSDLSTCAVAVGTDIQSRELEEHVEHLGAKVHAGEFGEARELSLDCDTREEDGHGTTREKTVRLEERLKRLAGWRSKHVLRTWRGHQDWASVPSSGVNVDISLAARCLVRARARVEAARIYAG